MHFKCSSLTGPAIPLIVQKQPSEERPYVHKDLLTYHSPAFRSKIEGPWAGVSTAEIDLSEEGRTMVLGLIEWFYTGRINRLEAWALGKKSGRRMSDPLDELFKLWDMGQRWLITDFVNYLLEQVKEMSSMKPAKRDGIACIPSVETLEWVFDHTNEDSLMRYVAVGITIGCSDCDQLRHTAGGVREDVAEALRNASLGILMKLKKEAGLFTREIGRHAWTSHGLFLLSEEVKRRNEMRTRILEQQGVSEAFKAEN